ncbi:pectinesterase family protein [Acholeplasma granularum]|uniref:pectinesterase family protein n=1 Tax=Acholeplasma granularum TaxID=264635 RepID=UPI0004AF4238|nr:pectinesterase family protein [Acholeplasma granularum]
MKQHYVTPQTDLQLLFDQLDPNFFHTIYLSKGTYRQKLKLSSSNVTLIGEDVDNTIIVYDDYSYKLHSDGLLHNTFRTSTFTITGSNNVLKHLTIVNDAGHGPRIGQAIALSIYGNHNSVLNCKILGNQDTLFIGPLPEDLSIRYAHILPLDERLTSSTKTTISNSTITGNVDFIFGSGNCLFKECTLIFNNDGYLAAPSTYENGIGFVFYHCIIKSLDPHFNIVLARPWREFGKTTFIHTNFIDLNIKDRYHTWDKSHFEFREFPYINDQLNKPLDDLFKQRITDLFFR